MGLTADLAECIADPRDPAKTTQDLKTLLRQRIFGMALGYEDLNDHATLRDDPLLAILTEQRPDPHAPRGSPSTRFRFENAITRGSLSWMSEVLPKGPNVRFVVTNLMDAPETIYDERYTARGDMENRIQEQPLGLFADRTSGQPFQANQFRLLLASAAYVLIEHLRRVGLAGIELAKAQVTTIRSKLFKIAVRVRVSDRRIVLNLSSYSPYQQLFTHLLRRLPPI